MSTSKNKIIAILGLGRSGTSVTARALHTLGINLGYHLMEANHANPKGFWEDTEVRDINENILRALDFTWDNLRINHTPINIQDARLDELNKSAKNLLKNRFLNTHYWGFKHPRTARLLPFWQAHFASLNLDDSYIISIRNPLSSTGSFKSLTTIDAEKMLMLWLLHLVPAINQTKGKKRVIVSYESLLDNPEKELYRIKNSLDIPYQPTQIETHNFVNDFLTKDLNRYAESYEAFKSHPATSKLCIMAYDLLNKLAHDELTFEDPEFVSGWNVVTENLNNLSPLYGYIDALLSKNAQLSNADGLLQKNNLQTSTIAQLQEKIRTLEAEIHHMTHRNKLKNYVKNIYQRILQKDLKEN